MRICSVDGCGGRYLAKGYCGKHYQRVWRGSPTPAGKYHVDPVDRFWQLVEPGDPEDCWEWRGNLGNKYGLFYRHPSHGGRIGAHRFSYELHKGAIGPGLFVCHRCDNPICVNPAHLFLGTPKENVADMDAKGRRVVRYPTGERSKLSVLNEHAAKFVLETDLSTAELSRIFGVTYNAIRAIRIGKSWKHLRK